MSRAALLALTAAACQPTVGADRAAVVGGVADFDHPSVVAIVNYRQACNAPEHARCSGVAVASRTVLTAAHCLDGVRADELEVMTGADVAAPSRIYAVTGGVVHPDYDAGAAPEASSDFALLFVDGDLDVAAAPLPGSLSADLTAGATVRYVGFGSTGPNDATGQRLAADAIIDSVAATAIVTGPDGVPCGGDSGGALWIDTAGGELLAGIVKASGPDCTAAGLALRVNVVADSFVTPSIAGYTPAARPPLDLAADLCGDTCAADADCPLGMLCLNDRDAMHCGIRDLRTTAFGDTCTTGADCVRVGKGPERTCRLLNPCDAVGGGCNSGGAPGPWLAVLIGLALQLGARRRCHTLRW